LDKLRGAHPIIDLITQYREVTKLKNTYIDTLPKQVDKSSRLHTTFSLTIAPTGRLSSSDPNLQNIPVRTDLGRRIRTAFVAGKGNALISADYSQFELRIAAALSGDKGMIDAFNDDADIHVQTAAEIYDIPPEKVTKVQRSSVKEVNFGIMYGLGPHALSQTTGMSFGEARDFIKRYFEIRPKLKEYIEKTRKLAEQQGYVETLLGRRRPTPDVHSPNFQVREAGMRAAVNMPLQGTAADIMKIAMINLAAKLEDDCKLLLQIHDSLILEVPKAKADKVGKLVKDTMESAYTKLPVKLKTDISTGRNWGEL
jgi:DNA polymerase-1